MNMTNIGLSLFIDENLPWFFQNVVHIKIDLIELTEVYETKKENIVKDTYDLENVLTPTYCEIALDLEKQIANLDVIYENIATTILEHG